MSRKLIRSRPLIVKAIHDQLGMAHAAGAVYGRENQSVGEMTHTTRVADSDWFRRRAAGADSGESAPSL